MLEGVWSVGLEDSLVSGLAGSVGSSENWELEAVFSDQVGSWSSDFVLSIENDGSDD